MPCHYKLKIIDSIVSTRYCAHKCSGAPYDDIMCPVLVATWPHKNARFTLHPAQNGQAATVKYLIALIAFRNCAVNKYSAQDSGDQTK